MPQNKIVKGNKTVVLNEEDLLTVIYHSTKVVEVDYKAKTITLNTGGWKTNTTKLRMNQAACQYNLGYCVFQKDFAWYIEYEGKTFEFDRHITLGM